MLDGPFTATMGREAELLSLETLAQADRAHLVEGRRITARHHLFGCHLAVFAAEPDRDQTRRLARKAQFGEVTEVLMTLQLPLGPGLRILGCLPRTADLAARRDIEAQVDVQGAFLNVFKGRVRIFGPVPLCARGHRPAC